MISLFDEATKKRNNKKPSAPRTALGEEGSTLATATTPGGILDPMLENRLEYMKKMAENLKKPVTDDAFYQAPSMLTGTERMRGTKARGRLLGGKKNANY